MRFVTHSFLAVAVQKLLKLFKLCQRYWHKFSATFFGPRCIWIFVTSSRYWLWNGRIVRHNVDGYRPECTPRCPEGCPEGVPCTARWSRNQLWFTDGQLTGHTNRETDKQTDRQTGRQTNRDERNVAIIRRGSSRRYLRCYHDVSIIAAAGCSSHQQCFYNLDLPWPVNLVMLDAILFRTTSQERITVTMAARPRDQLRSHCREMTLIAAQIT